jgi:Na+(H+)/acetate symporter ActP
VSAVAAVLGVVLTTLLTLGVGVFGLRLSRTTSDFYVASRAVGPGLNASAISGEYLSAASFLGVAGLVLSRGVDMLWYPVGWTAGYLVLLVFVAAPLRRSRAYTLPDFTELRVESRRARNVASAMVVVIAVLYLVPQFQGAGLTLAALTGTASWVGGVLVALVVLVIVVSGGMRSITLVQAVQYWLKLTALLVPLAILLVHTHGGADATTARLHDQAWRVPLQRPHALYLTYSLIVATFLGTMGLPHVVVRFYTNPDGRAARRTTVRVLVLLGLFYLLPTAYGVLGRLYVPHLAGTPGADVVVLRLPARVLDGTVADVVTAILGAGAFAAFLSTSSGLVVSIAGVVGQDVLGRRLPPVAAFRAAGAVGALVTLGITALSSGLAVAQAVELAFTVAASTFCPLLLLGIWWRGLTAAGAIAGLLTGGLLSASAVVTAMLGATPGGWLGAVVGQPALCTVPVAFLTMTVVSLMTQHRLPAHLESTMVRLHAPEALDLDRGGFVPVAERAG